MSTSNIMSRNDDKAAYLKFTPNNAQIIKFMCFIFTSGIATGYGLAYTNSALPVINQVFGWTTQNQQTLWDSIVSCTFVLGAGIGASTGGSIVQRGRRNAHFIACGLGICGCAL